MKALNTYLNFDGTTGQAMKFYQQCLGGDLHLMPFSEVPGDYPKEAKDRIMHARLAVGPLTLMASDIMPGMQFHQGNNFSICLDCESNEEIERLFSALGNGGKTTMPLHDAFWGARFGMVADKFGISWMFNFEKPRQQ
jgi:PhnB protein